MSAGGGLLELPNPFPTEYGKVLLHEPPDADREALLESIRSGSYDKPFVADDGDARTLYFSLIYVQSCMRIEAPDALELAYTRKMMAFLLFHTNPRSLLLLGLGGGSLAKFCHRRLPLAKVVAVEISPQVIAFRELFGVPPDDARFRVIEADAADYLAAARDKRAGLRVGPKETCERHDVIMIDAFDRHGLASSISSPEFYADVRAALLTRGVLVCNLAGLREERAAHLELMMAAFGDNLLVLPVEDDGNEIVFAFRDAGFEPRWRWINSQAQAMRSRYGLDFPRFAAKLERGSKLGYLQRSLGGAA